MTLLIFNVAFACWTIVDGLLRKLGFIVIPWAIGVAILGPFILPFYFALRPLHLGETREGGTAWNVFKGFVIFWTVMCAYMAISAMFTMAKNATDLGRGDAASIGTAIGFTLGMGLIGAVWLFPVIGALVLGLFLKKNSVIEQGPTGALAGEVEGGTLTLGRLWGGAIGATAFGAGALVFGLIVDAVIAEVRKSPRGSSSIDSALSGETTKATSKWQFSESKSEMSDTPIAGASIEAEGSIKGWLESKTPSLTIRCKERSIDAYINLGMQPDTNYGSLNTTSVRIRFDDGSPVKQRWTQSTDNQALFAPNGAALAKQIASAKTFLFEFTPFNASPATARFDVSGFSEYLPKITAACGPKGK